MKEIFENLRENVSEACFEDIVNTVEAILSEADKYIVTSKHDNGELKTTTYADSAKKAEELVNKAEGGPSRAHKVLVKDNPERTAEAVKKAIKGKNTRVKIGVAKNGTLQTPYLDKVLKENVSEVCFEDIVSMVEAYINELKPDTMLSSTLKRIDNTSPENKDFRKLVKLGNNAKLISKKNLKFEDPDKQAMVDAITNAGKKVEKYEKDPSRKNANAATDSVSQLALSRKGNTLGDKARIANKKYSHGL